MAVKVEEIKTRTITAHFTQAELQRLVLAEIAKETGVQVGGHNPAIQIKMRFERREIGSPGYSHETYCNAEIVEDLNFVAPVEAAGD